jgi:glycosyltransferase involved in cell wall biosynthesis
MDTRPTRSPDPEADELRVLLMAPVEGRDPESGDLAYTDALLANPPSGVRYTSYAEALASGTMTIRGRRPHHGGLSPVDLGLLLVRGVESWMRGGLMFREPYWYVSISRDHFDLVHHHLFTLRQVGAHVPAVSSAGYPLSVVYQVQDGWTGRRAKRAERWERVYSRVMRAHTPGLWAPRGELMTVYTSAFRDYLLSTTRPQATILLCGQGLASVDAPPRRPRGCTLGFIGRDFGRKGGDIALDAFALLRRDSPDATMIVATRADAYGRRAVPPGVTLVTDATRARVRGELLPNVDLLLLPTRADCGAPYGLLEALCMGIPAIVSDIEWLDARLVPPAVHRVPAQAPAVAEAARTVLGPERLPTARVAARALWREHFSMERFHLDLLQAYQAALAAA